MDHLVLQATYQSLERQLSQFREAIEGLPDHDLKTWKPSTEPLGGGPMNTFSALAAHITGAGVWRVYQQVYGDMVERHRDAEFQATISAEEIGQMFDDWLAGFQERLNRETQPDLSSLPQVPPEDRPDWTRLQWLLSLVDHTALHVGHAQIHRQLWESERKGLSSDRQSIH